MKPTQLRVLALGALAVMAACAHEIRPTDMTAEQHRATADKERRQAEQEAKGDWADSPGASPLDVGHKPELYINPDATETVTDARASHVRALELHAREHEEAAAELEKFEDEQCKSVSTTERRTCPLLGPIAQARDIDGGVELRLGGGAEADSVLLLMRCHYAYARAHGFAGGKDCALYVPGVELRGTSDPHVIDIVGKDAKATAEIRRRVHAGALARIIHDECVSDGSSPTDRPSSSRSEAG